MENMIRLGEQRQADIEAAKAAFFMGGGKPVDLGSYNANPLPLRSAKVDPDTILARRRSRPSAAERAKLRKMADSI